MDAERFADLAEAYGGQVARWPHPEREAAAAFMAAEPAQAQATLARAEALDAVLDAWRPVAVTGGLREAVIAGAPAPRAGMRGWLWSLGAGAGLAGACASGLLMGVMLYGPASPQSQTTEPISAAMTSYDLSSTAEARS